MYKFLLAFPQGKAKALTLSYDDGVDTDIRLIGLLEKYNIKCTFNISSGLFSEESAVRAEDQIHFRLPESRALTLYRHPLCEVATHGYIHPFYNKLPPSAVMCDILDDRRGLENLFGKIIRGHAYPYGAFNDTIIDIFDRAGIAYARTTKASHSFSLPRQWLSWDPTCHHADPGLPELTDRFVGGKVGNNEDGWLFYLWGHTYEFRRDDNWNIIETFLEKVAGCEDIWFASNMEIFEYVTAWRSLVVSANGKMVQNPTATDVWIKTCALSSKPTEIIQIPAGETITLV